ncbi:MAG: hypothetical protein OEY25_11120, partial [Candidatus Aminicenantes bacterium]|nr:hypothetical protein [Candidatus Aminicenantes bacterium]
MIWERYKVIGAQLKTQIALGLRMKTEGVRIIIREFQKGVVMKKSVLLFPFLLIFSSVIYAQEIIENPEKPLSEKAGRVVNLERILQVKDTGA